MLERTISAEGVLRELGANLAANLPNYVRTTPEERSREMQAAAFGEKPQRVSESEYTELIENVRAVRAWLIAHGKTASDHPEFKNTPEHKIYWKKDGSDPDSPYISIEPRPWDQQSGRNLEPYPKFTFETASPTQKVQFELNFDDTYYLAIELPGNPTRFVSSDLSRREMTKQEYAIVRSTILEATSRYSIPLLKQT